MLLKLLAFPVTGPIRLVTTVAEEIEKSYYDPATILAEFERLRAAHRAGDLDDDDWKAAKSTLNQRLTIARERGGAA